MEQEQDIQKEIDILVQDILKILHSLNDKFPKLIGDIILTMQETMKDSSVAQQILNSMENEVAEESKKHMSHECMPQEDSMEYQGFGWNSLTGIDIKKELARSGFSLKEENDSECLPCDGVPNMPIAMGILGESSKKHSDALRSIQTIKNSVQKLNEHKIRMKKNSKAFEGELKVVNLILDFVEDYCG